VKCHGEHRSRSISLLTALLRQDGYHFTVLTPDVGRQQPDKRNPLAVAAAAAWLGVGFVMVVAVACCARGAPAWDGPSVVPQSVLGWLSRVYASFKGRSRPRVCQIVYNMDNQYVFWGF
jgi:hypothetical protein